MKKNKNNNKVSIAMQLQKSFDVFCENEFKKSDPEKFRELAKKAIDNRRTFDDKFGGIVWSKVIENVIKAKATEGWEDANSDTIESARVSVVEDIMDFVNKKIKDDNGNEVRMWKNNVVIRLATLSCYLDRLKNNLQVKRLLEVVNIKFEGDVYVYKIIKGLKKVDEGTKELLDYLKENGTFKKFRYIDIKENGEFEEKEACFKFLNEVNDKVLHYLLVNCDFFGDCLSESMKNLAQSREDKERLEEKIKIDLIAKAMSGILSSKAEKYKIEEYKKIKSLIYMPGISIDKYTKMRQGLEDKINKMNRKKSSSKAEVLDKLRELESYVSSRIDRISSSSQDAEYEIIDDIVDYQDYADAIMDDCDKEKVLRIFDQFGKENNPSKEDGISILLEWMSMCVQGKKDIKKYYEVLEEEIKRIENYYKLLDDTRIDLTEILIKASETSEILDKFLGMIEDKESIRRAIVDWNKVFLAYVVKNDEIDSAEINDAKIEDTKAKDAKLCLDILIEKGKAIFGTNWEKEFVNIKINRDIRGMEVVSDTLIDRYYDKLDKILLLKEFINVDDETSLNEYVDSNGEDQLQDVLSKILPYTCEVGKISLFKSLLVRYRNNNVINQVFDAIYKDGVQSDLIPSGSIKDLRKKIFSDKDVLMCICRGVSDIEYLEKEYKFTINETDVSSLMISAVKTGDLNIVKHVLSKVGGNTILDDKWIKSLEQMGTSEYREIIDYINERNIGIELSGERKKKLLEYLKEDKLPSNIVCRDELGEVKKTFGRIFNLGNRFGVNITVPRIAMKVVKKDFRKKEEVPEERAVKKHNVKLLKN